MMSNLYWVAYAQEISQKLSWSIFGERWMAGNTFLKIYWANALFSQADRDFNANCATFLRNAGYCVFLPQEATVNKPSEERSPLADDIFRVDTSEILESRLLIACLDQEAIDSGVACEIGIAFAYGIPIVGLYTDIRQHRRGLNRMYKNPYVIGAIEAIGEIVSDVNDLLRVIPKYLQNLGEANLHLKFSEHASQHFDSVALRYTEFVSRLESWYVPKWNIKEVVDKWFKYLRPKRVIEFGCGTGYVGGYISHQYPDTFYLGHDNSLAMIQLASRNYNSSNCRLTASWQEATELIDTDPFDVALVFFTLHDLDNPQDIVSLLARCVQPGGNIIITDLSTSDLPRLTDLLRRKLARPLLCSDNRLTPNQLTKFAKLSNTDVTECNITMPLINFPSADGLDEYLEFFGIYDGMDLPLALNSNADKHRQLIKKVLDNQRYPYEDQRAFITCALKKL